MTEKQYAWCDEHVEFEVHPPVNGEAVLTTTDERLSAEDLVLATLSSRRDLIIDAINACHACKGNVANCVLIRGNQ